MARPVKRCSTRQSCIRRLLLACQCVAILAVTACKPTGTPSGTTDPSPEKPQVLASQLAAARTAAAAAKLADKRADEALALLVSALRADPHAHEARSLAGTILGQAAWNFPTLTSIHPGPIEHIDFAPPSSLWVSLGPARNTTVRWNLENLEIEGVLFPRTDCKTRSLVFDRRHRFVVIERGEVCLLCDARTLKPIRDLGKLPPDLTPAAVIVFSEDGLLLGHPTYASAEDRSIIWHLRDSSTGQIIRSSEPDSLTSPRPLAAHLDRQHLQVLLANGTLLEVPVSPVEPITSTPLDEPVKLLHAQFSLDGKSVLTVKDQGAHQAPVRSISSTGDADDGSLKIDALTTRFPWSQHPNLWNSLMREPAQDSISVDQGTLRFATATHAPILTPRPLRAISLSQSAAVSGQDDGTLTIHSFLPLPRKIAENSQQPSISAPAVAALDKLAQALTALRFDETSAAFHPLSPTARREAAEHCDLGQIQALFPQWDFSKVLEKLREIPSKSAGPHAFNPLLERLAQAAPIAEQPAEFAAWEAIFRKGDAAAVLTTIQAAGKSGHAAATALALALKSENPAWIEACLNQAENLPPLLRQICVSRIAWLQGRKADALSAWPEIFPELSTIRLREDWQGWEQVDFQPALDNIRECVRGELDAIAVPKNSTPEKRRVIAARLLDRATLTAVGPRRFSDACLKAALAFSSFKEETQTTFQLASLARNMGAPPEPCLRAEALALTASGDSINAHPRWIELITEHPVATHLPGDYAEAAYTAFENSDPRQAMEILTTGMHRFPNDGNFALRAGWVALLTGNSERAYRFLREGQRIGFPPEKQENGTALLTIAATLTGATDDAAVYFQDLLRIDQAWADPATLQTLDWPKELKSVLRQFTQGP